MPSDDYAADLSLALQLADAADALTLSRFGALDLRVASKPDRTPVSDADEAVERLLRDRLGAHRPGDALLGEEFGGNDAGPASPRRWILDPVDGTKNFVRGVPVWATLLALTDAGRVAVGVVSAPALGRRWWAARGAGAWVAAAGGPPRRCRVSGVARLADAFLSYSSRSGWGPGFDALAAQVWRTRAFGDFWSHVLVAEGAVDVSAEPEVALWDVAPLQVIVEEAGGVFTDLAGRPRPDGGSVVCSNGLLHDGALRLLAEPGFTPRPDVST